MNLTQEQKDYFWERVDKSGGEDACWNWTGAVSANGYGSVCYNYKNFSTNNLTLKLTIGPPLDALRNNALHSCKQNRKCCNPAHLSWGTKKKNNGEDKVRDGTMSQGESHGSSKLTELQIKEIRAKYATGKYLQKELAEEYNMHLQSIKGIISHRTWKHI